ncbi:MAG: glycosyltransferase family 2 protein [Treponema sp.]|nr:glycosyltransferase family 2 protein [Treponema sp.]
MKKIYIVIINYNGSEDTCCCIDNLEEAFKNLFDIGYRVVLVDNASIKPDKNKIQDYLIRNSREKVIFVANSRNSGFASGNNLGIKYLKEHNLLDNETYIWFLNNDTKVSSELLSAIKNHLPKEREVLYCEMRNFNNEFVNDGLNYINLTTGMYSENNKKNYEPYICGASVFLKWCADFPLWDENYFLYFEDVEYSFLLKTLGYRFIKVPNAYYQHKINASSGKNSKTKYFRLRSQKIFMKNHSKNYGLFKMLKSAYLVVNFRVKELVFFLTYKV